MKTTRSDKKFEVKVWQSEYNKKIFRGNCFKYHLSMMFVTEQFLIKTLNDFDDDELRNIINKRINFFNKLKVKEQNYKTIGTTLTNNYWQKLAYFAVEYDTSLAKIASCIFDFGLTSYQLQEIYGTHGLHFKQKKIRGNLKKVHKRLSDCE